MKRLSDEQIRKRIKQRYESKKRSYERMKNKKRAEYLSSERYYLGLVRFSNRSGSHVGCFRALMSETDEHIIEKFVEWLFLRREGHRILCEPIFLNGKRADLLDLSSGTVVEVLKSETDDMFKEKVKDYPEELLYEVVRCV